MTDELVRILDGNTFVVSDRRGDIEATATDPTGFFSFDTSPCYSETCSGYGTCEVQGENASCLCNEGYAPGEELSCVCVPDCSGKECGGDGCGGGCGPGCSDTEYCDEEAGGQCMPNGDPTSCTSADRWLGTVAAAAATEGLALRPTGLTGRSRECAA